MWVRVGWMAGSLAEDLGLSAPVWLDCVFSRCKCQFAVFGLDGKMAGRDAQCFPTLTLWPFICLG